MLCVFLGIERELVNVLAGKGRTWSNNCMRIQCSVLGSAGCLPLPCCFSPSLTTDWKTSRAKFCSHHNMKRLYSIMS